MNLCILRTSGLTCEPDNSCRQELAMTDDVSPDHDFPEDIPIAVYDLNQISPRQDIFQIQGYILFPAEE